MVNECENLVVELSSLAETERFCRLLCGHLSGGIFLALCGDLGAGKTTFTRLLTEFLECKTLATSPTFSLFQQYTDGRLPVFHADLYRLGSEDELYELGWDEILDEYSEGIVVVEWADKFQTAWPQDHLVMDFCYGEGDEERQIALTAQGSQSMSLLQTVTERWSK